MNRKVEKIAFVVFTILGLIAVLSVFAITIYMIVLGTPAFFKVGIFKLIFNNIWAPTADTPSYGIFYIILSSIVVTCFSVAIAVPISILTAVFLTDFTSDNKFARKIAKILSYAIELLASIPSVIYGLLGLMILNPAMYKLETMIFASDSNHQFTGGANLLSAVIVLSIMILPTIISSSASSIKQVRTDLKLASLSLGATKLETIFKIVLPSAKTGILTGVILGIGRALGEAMAINMVSGGAVNLPFPFNSVSFLTTKLVSEMSYSSGIHREVLFSIGLILYIFIVIINLVLSIIRRKKEHEND